MNIIFTVIGTVVFFGALSVVAYVEQKTISNEQAKFANSWCDVDFGSSKATIECSKVSRLESK
jgi:hypothetical protein